MSETLTIAQFKELTKTQPNLFKKKGKGDKAKAEIEMMLKLAGVAYEKEYLFAKPRKWRFDFAMPALKLAIEYEGVFSEKSRHTTVTGYTNDANKYNAAVKLGWRVLRYTALNYKNLSNDLNSLKDAKH